MSTAMKRAATTWLAGLMGGQIMNATTRTFGLLWVAAAVAGTWAAEGTESAEESASQRLDWTAEIEALNLRPADVRIVREPNVERELATLKRGDKLAPTDYHPGPRYSSFVKGDGATCELVYGGLKPGTMYHTDRTYELVDIPAKLEGLTLLQTKMGHKSIVDGRYSIVVSFSQPGYCFVALDERCVRTYQESGMPSWLEEYSLTDYRIATSDANMRRGGKQYIVLAKHVAGDRVALGPSAGHPHNNAMYFAFFASAEGAEDALQE
jgi:hypothetical protein